jgi:AcrR family transcriptional regulator
MRKAVAADAQSKNEEIFAHAVRVFKAKGYHAASMQDIADAVGLQKGSLYHYISSKDELLFKIFERGTGALSKQLEEIIDSDDSPTNKLHRAIEAHLAALCDQLDIYTVYLSERRTFGGKLNSKVRAEGERHARLLERLIEQGIKSGDFRQVDVKMSAHAILGMCNWLYQWYSPDGRLQPHEIAVIFSDLMIDGLTNKSAKSRPRK